jgi:hypothetical protein
MYAQSKRNHKKLFIFKRNLGKVKEKENRKRKEKR